MMVSFCLYKVRKLCKIHCVPQGDRIETFFDIKFLSKFSVVQLKKVSKGQLRGL